MGDGIDLGKQVTYGHHDCISLEGLARRTTDNENE